jgi:hypothetical protein
VPADQLGQLSLNAGMLPAHRMILGFGKDVCKISGRQEVVQELKETLAYPHFDFGSSFCTVFHDFTAPFAFLTLIRIAVQQVDFWHCLSPKALNDLNDPARMPVSKESNRKCSHRLTVPT